GERRGCAAVHRRRSVARGDRHGGNARSPRARASRVGTRGLVREAQREIHFRSSRHAAMANVIPIVALDYSSAKAALALVDQLGNRCSMYKVGNELFTTAGPPILEEL